MTRTYKGFTFTKTGRQPWDWRCNFDGRTRWGTLAELQIDADKVVAGVGLPAKQRGYA